MTQGGSDFGPPEIARALEEAERKAAIEVVSRYAKDEAELQTFAQMLGLVDA